jgi:hypothetical protein
MPGRLRNTLLAGALAIAIGGCGGDDEGSIPNDDSAELLRLVDSIESETQNGNCELAQQQALEFSARVDALPQDVDPEVRQGLDEASQQIEDLTQDPTECAVTGATDPSEVETTTEEEPETTTDEEPETTTDEEPPPEEDEPAPEEEEGDQPLEVPGENGEDGDGGRGSSSGGVEPERAQP